MLALDQHFASQTAAFSKLCEEPFRLTYRGFSPSNAINTATWTGLNHGKTAGADTNYSSY